MPAPCAMSREVETSFDRAASSCGEEVVAFSFG